MPLIAATHRCHVLLAVVTRRLPDRLTIGHTGRVPEYEDRPRALQLAARIEKTDPPELADVFGAAALGVIMMLDHAKSLPGGEWHDDVAAWNGSRIRKIMRRARASAWQRAQEVPGLTVRHGTAEVRIFVPGIIEDAPPELSKLQIQSTPLDEPEPTSTLEPVNGPTLTVALDPAVEMSWGKRGAQVAHASQRLWEQLDRSDRLNWNAASRPVRVLTPTGQLWEELVAAAPVVIKDGGFTEIAPGTRTCCALLSG